MENINSDSTNMLGGSVTTSTIIIDMSELDEGGEEVSDSSLDLNHSIQALSHESYLPINAQPSKHEALLARFKSSPKKGRKRRSKYADILPQEPPFICPFEGCGKVLQDRLKLRSHYGNHQERKHICQYCGQKFLYLKDKRIHERSHTGERPFVCQVCKKAFIQKCTLANHLTTHSNSAKTEKCDICGRTYYYKKTLAQHKKEKHGELFDQELFVCPLCGKKYMGTYWYNIHLKKCKSKEDDCKCDLCGEQFRKQTLLKKHKNSCPQRHVYQCGVCNIILRTEEQLREHMQAVHNVGFEDCLQVQLTADNSAKIDAATVDVTESSSNRTEILLKSNLNLSHDKFNLMSDHT